MQTVGYTQQQINYLTTGSYLGPYVLLELD